MSFAYYSATTTDHTQVPSNQSNFPVLVSLTDARFKSVANGGHVQSASGYDLIPHSDSALTTRLSFEREFYSPTTGQIVFWVKVASLSSSADNSIHWGYGDAAIVTDQQDATNVWDADYKGVWHLPDGTTLGLSDSKGSYNLTNTDATATGGQIDGAANFSGSSQYASNSSLSITAGSSITISYWNYVATVDVQASSAFTIGSSSDPNRIQAHSPYSDKILYWDYGNSVVGEGRVTKDYTAYLDAWTYVVLTYAVSGTLHSIYLNGSSVASSVNSNAPTATQTGIDIGGWSSGGLYHKGKLDEFRVSTIARSADWITAEYNNQKPSSTFITLQSEQQISSMSIYVDSSPTFVYSWKDYPCL